MLRTLADCGYDGVEFNLTEPSAVAAGRLVEFVGEYGLAVPSFLTGEAYFDGLCLSSPQGDVRRRTVERLIRYLDTVERFGAVMVVGLLQGMRRDEPDAEVAAGRIADCLGVVAREAERRGVVCVIEPVNHLQVGFHNSVAEVLGLIARVGSRSIRPMVDTVHMNIEERSLVEPIRACGADLAHVHLCESNGGRFGTGCVDFAGVLRELDQIGYAGWGSVKVYRHLEFEEAARSSIDFLRRIR
jgi:sugar phosphate isomerase/epimerase